MQPGIVDQDHHFHGLLSENHFYILAKVLAYMYICLFSSSFCLDGLDVLCL